MNTVWVDLKRYTENDQTYYEFELCTYQKELLREHLLPRFEIPMEQYLRWKEKEHEVECMEEHYRIEVEDEIKAYLQGREEGKL